MKNKEETKLKIFNKALEIYVESPMQFSVMKVAKELKMTREHIYASFSSKNAILRYYYQLCFKEYLKQIDEISDYEKFTLEEKLGHLVYTHIELFQKEKEFVESTFNEIIFKANSNNIFQKSLEEQIEKILRQSEGDASILPGRYLSKFLVKELFHIFKFWIKDDSEQSEQTIELVDKIIAFAGEVLGNQIITKGLDLGKLIFDKNFSRYSSKDYKLIFNSLLNRFA